MMLPEHYQKFQREVRDLYTKYGPTSKFVRAYCKAQGWKHTPQGAPAEWYEWWPVIVEALQ